MLRSYLRQRATLVAYASHHIQHMQKALTQMNVKLQHVVSDITGATGLRIIKAIFESLPDEKRAGMKKDLVGYAEEVAAASGGFLGLGSKVSEKEQAVISRVAREFAASHAEASKQVVEKL